MKNKDWESGEGVRDPGVGRHAGVKTTTTSTTQRRCHTRYREFECVERDREALFRHEEEEESGAVFQHTRSVSTLTTWVFVNLSSCLQKLLGVCGARWDDGEHDR